MACNHVVKNDERYLPNDILKDKASKKYACTEAFLVAAIDCWENGVDRHVLLLRHWAIHQKSGLWAR